MISATPKTLDDILSARATGSMLPKITELEKAAARLETLTIPAPAKPARKLPPELSADML